MKKTIAIIIVAVGILSWNYAAEKEVTLKLTVPEAEYVLQALQDKPYKEAAPLINKIIYQAQSQLADTTKSKK
jgi:hypothetical protein